MSIIQYSVGTMGGLVRVLRGAGLGIDFAGVEYATHRLNSHYRHPVQSRGPLAGLQNAAMLSGVSFQTPVRV